MSDGATTALDPQFFLAGGGETGRLIRSIDWSKTSLGPSELWPQSLKTCIRIILTSRQPMFVWWGKEFINIYNDAYIDILQGKHPNAMGQRAKDVWPEIWDSIEPRVESCIQKDEGTYDEALLLIMHRNGYPEETYYTFSYSPVPGEDGKPSGILCANTDDTERIIGERQLRTLKDLGKRLTDNKTNEEVYRETIKVLEENPQDFPFAILYSLSSDSKSAAYIAMTGSEQPHRGVQEFIDLTAPHEVFQLMASVAETNKAQIVEGITDKFGTMPAGAWDKPPERALVLPVSQTGQQPYAFLVVGMNPYRVIDEKYQSFFQLVADQVATSISNVHAYEQEKRRAEALAEIDRAKTTFFSNISHEFRTPLTLMMGPLQDTLDSELSLSRSARDNLKVSLRNTLRLQKLVNALLDFSRIEAGRMKAVYQPVNITSLTEDLTSTFRSAVEKAGMQLIVHYEAIDEPVYVDVDMWEKIVLNLLSNAFKYTEKGSIEVSLKTEGSQVKLSVKDTGIGIPEDELENIFQRFHRIQTVQGRSQEGTGIGLSLVQELVMLHQGSINVESKLGKGSVFTVYIPLGKQHLPKEAIGEESVKTNLFKHVDAYISEALKWESALTAATEVKPRSHSTEADNIVQKKVLLADDNADMRSYVQRLLQPNYEVIAVANGKLALQVAKTQHPDLIISDVMMPEMDGFELLRHLKSDTELKNIPVILLSARAGEEATIDGLRTGADDYLVKPFSAKELLTRVESSIRASEGRLYALKQLRNLFMQAPVALAIFSGPQLKIELANDAILKIWGKTNAIIGKPVLDALPEIAGTGYPQLLRSVYEKGIVHHANESSAYLIRNGNKELVYFNFIYHPFIEIDGKISGVIVLANEVTDMVKARKKVEESDNKFRSLIAESPTAIAILKGEDMVVAIANEAIIESWGKGFDIIGKPLASILPEAKEQGFIELFQNVYKTGQPFYGHETSVQLNRNGKEEFVYYNFVCQAQRGEDGKIEGVAIIANEVTPHALIKKQLEQSEQKYRQLAGELEIRVENRTMDLIEANKQLERSNKELEQFAFVTSHDLQEPLRKIMTFSNMLYEKNKDQITGQAKWFLDRINNAASRMSKLINDLLNFSRLQRSSDSFLEVDLNNVLHNVELDFEVMINQKKASIKADHLPLIEAIPLQMNQLFYNLISNSLKFTTDDVLPVIEISCRRLSSLEVTQRPLLSEDKSYFELTFADNGIGFNQQYEHKIFEIFQRLNTRLEYEGTGIGLALCSTIVQNHNGQIHAESEEGRGARFYVILPEKQSPV